jgi:hypothetical protein
VYASEIEVEKLELQLEKEREIYDELEFEETDKFALNG